MSRNYESKLDELYAAFLRRRKKTVFDGPVSDSSTAYREYLKQLSDKAVNGGLIQSRRALKDMDTIDYSRMVSDDMSKNMPAALPFIDLTDEDFATVGDNWYLIIPPFKEGVLRINRSRYLRFEISAIIEECKGYGVILQDYSCDNHVWLLENEVSAGVVWDSAGTPSYEEMPHCFLRHSIGEGIGLGDICEQVFGRTSGWSDNDRLFFDTVLIPASRNVFLEDDLDSVVTHFTLAVIQCNLQLQAARPKAVRGSGRKVISVAGEVDKAPKARIVRTLSGGIQISSVKPPKLMTGELVRKYKLAAWGRRGHARHYKSGKTVWISPTTVRRKCLVSTEDVTVPQKIIRMSSDDSTAKEVAT